MGKKDKAHRAKVAKRNQRLSIEKKKFEKEYQQMMSEKIEELRQKFASMSGETSLLGAEVVDTKEQPTEDTTEQE